MMRRGESLEFKAAGYNDLSARSACLKIVRASVAVAAGISAEFSPLICLHQCYDFMLLFNDKGERIGRR